MDVHSGARRHRRSGDGATWPGPGSRCWLACCWPVMPGRRRPEAVARATATAEATWCSIWRRRWACSCCSCWCCCWWPGRRRAAQALWTTGGDRRNGRRPDDGPIDARQPVAAAAWSPVPAQLAGPAGHAQPVGCADVPAGGRCRAGPGGAAWTPAFCLYGQPCRHCGAVCAWRRPGDLAVPAARSAGRGLHRIRTFRWHIDEHHGLPCVAAYPCRPRYHAGATGADRDCLRCIG